MSSLKVVVHNCQLLEKHFLERDLWRYKLADGEVRLHGAGMRALLWFKETLLMFWYSRSQRQKDTYTSLQERNIKLLSRQIDSDYQPSLRELQIARVSLRRFQCGETATPLLRELTQDDDVKAFLVNKAFDRLNPLLMGSLPKQPHQLFGTLYRHHELLPSYSKTDIPEKMWEELGCQSFWEEARKGIQKSLKKNTEPQADVDAVVTDIFSVVPQLKTIILGQYEGNFRNRMNGKKLLHDLAKEQLNEEGKLHLNHKIDLILAKELRGLFISQFSLLNPVSSFRHSHLEMAKEFITIYFPDSKKKEEIARTLLNPSFNHSTKFFPLEASFEAIKKDFAPLEETAKLRYKEVFYNLRRQFKDPDVTKATTHLYTLYPELIHLGHKKFFSDLIKQALFHTKQYDEEKTDRLIDQTLVKRLYSRYGSSKRNVPTMSYQTLKELSDLVIKAFPTVTDRNEQMRRFYYILRDRCQDAWVENVGATELLPETDLAASLIKALFALRCKKAKDARKKPFDSPSFSSVQEREFVTFAKKALTDFPEISHALEHTKEPSTAIDAYKKAVRDIFMKHPDTLRTETDQLFKKALLAHTHALFRQAHSLPKIEKDTPLYTTSQLDTAIRLATAYFPKEPHTYVYSIMMGRPIDCTQKDFPIPNTYTLTKTDTGFTIERRRIGCSTS